MSASAIERMPLIGFAGLAQRQINGVDLQPLSQQLLTHAQNDGPDAASCLLDLAVILQFNGGADDALAVQLQRQALLIQRVYRLPAHRQPAVLTVLLLVRAGLLLDNLPVDALLADSDIDLIWVYVDSAHLPVAEDLPEHDVLLVAVGESDASQTLLQQLDDCLHNWPRPVLNRPARIADMARPRAAQLLADVPGLFVPACGRLVREVLLNLNTDDLWPCLIRPLGSHAGKGLALLNHSADLAAYLAEQNADEFMLSQYVDYASADGLYRKYRIAFIDGRPQLCHLAISEHWMVHYLNAGMSESADKRAEEAHAMDYAFEAEFLPRHRQALSEIPRRLGLDYFAMDCAELSDGGLLLFEVDTAMIVHNLDPQALYPYKHRHMPRVFAEFRRCLLRASARPL